MNKKRNSSKDLQISVQIKEKQLKLILFQRVTQISDCSIGNSLKILSQIENQYYSNYQYNFHSSILRYNLKAMSQNEADPLRFLNIRKKRESNKQKVKTSIPALKEIAVEKCNQFVLPSWSSFSSLEDVQCNKIEKRYTPSKYFNPEVEQYLNKLKKIKITNWPIISEHPQQGNTLEKTNEIERLPKQVEKETISMVTFSKNCNFNNDLQTEKQTKTAEFNFYNKPGLRKSGSMKIMEQIQLSNFSNAAPNENNILTGQMFENNYENQVLKQCQICSRKFNPSSYQKHTKVCEKVFFQKRQRFNSRSNSLGKKTELK